MEHQEALPFVSAVMDGQSVPAEAAAHIQGCAVCRSRLRDYEELGVELRLLAAREEAEVGERRWNPPARTRLSVWLPSWGGRVFVPKPALALGMALIVGLSAGLGYVRAQGRSWLKIEITSPQSENVRRWGAQVAVGGMWSSPYSAMGQRGHVWARFRALGVENGAVRLAVQARRFDGNTPDEAARRALEGVPAREYRYTPGKTLEIPVEGWGTLSLGGQVLGHPEEFSWGVPANEPSPDTIALNRPVLIRDNQVIFQLPVPWGSASGPNPKVSLYVPGEGLFAFRLGHFYSPEALKNEVPGVADFGHVRFELGGKRYLLACATPITGGRQPRQIWVYLDRSFPPSKALLEEYKRLGRHYSPAPGD